MMHPIHVDMSPGSAVKCLPLRSPHAPQEEDLQRSSRDEYYYRRDSHLYRQATHSHTKPENSSAATMLELELDAILRGDESARQRSVHRSTEDAKPAPVLTPPQPLLIATLSSRQTSPKVEEEARATKDVSGHGGSAMLHYDSTRRRRLAMRWSIDRFLSAGEERAESNEKIVHELADNYSANRLSLRDTPPVVSPSPEALPTPIRDGIVEESTKATGGTSRALFTNRSGKAPSGAVVVENRENRHSPLRNVPEGVKSASSRRRGILQSIPTNTMVAMPSGPATQRSSSARLGQDSDMNSPSPQVDAGAYSRCDDTDARFTHPSNGIPSIVSGAEFMVTCDRCRISLKLVVFYPSNSSPSVKFCPLCGGCTALGECIADLS
ncbi:hypothetical protein ABL78_1782 [Leptomonas seymouri]|uniref:Uncharacterized protein n=1 Tax=Leptomonas seymouri TaxID=5684 RepID=A0A0N1I080_LEPSE|nr:hypothetical protein ABL78_1782 [Leptomonas seymouri]|eukprot:KPI89138.1 hypothetical protein ABL78_1782 [Leptomonas seymouri]